MLPRGGHLKISAVTLKEGPKNSIQITVQDEGRGIPKEVLPHVFDLFVTTKKHGLGYGLWRTKNTIEMLEGTIKIDSVENQGTTVVILLPISPGHQVSGSQSEPVERPLMSQG